MFEWDSSNIILNNLKKQLENDEEIMLKSIGISNPTKEDISLIEFYKAGICKEEAITMKEMCDKSDIDYSVLIAIRNSL